METCLTHVMCWRMRVGRICRGTTIRQLERDESVVGGCAGRRGSCANAHRGAEDRALHERSPVCPDVKTAWRHREAAKQVGAKKEALAKATAALAGAEDHYRDLLDRRRALAAREEEQDFYEENEYDMETDHVGQWWRADKLGNSWQESWGQSYWKEDDRASPDLMQPSLEIDMLKLVIAEAQQTQHAFQQSISRGGKCEVPATCCEHVGQALGSCPASSFHSCGYGGAIYTKPGLEREEASGDLGVNTDFPTPRVPEDEDELTVQQIALHDQPPHL